MSSENRFGYEWNRYARLSPDYEKQFLNWTHPFDKEFWQGKRILDAGCGMGRNSLWPMQWGAASAVAFDFDERSVSRAKETLKAYENAEVLYRSIYDIGWEKEFDVVFSIGVIHHLEEPQRALANLVRALRPGGTLLAWVYSYEGNEWITKMVDPVRINVTSRLPVRLVHFLAYFCSIPLYLYLKFRKSQSGYLKQLATFDFWHVHSIVFDQLIPEVANYWKKEEVTELVEGLPLVEVSVKAPPNKSGWILAAKKA
jgi:SAM-dependent methyltransferase